MQDSSGNTLFRPAWATIDLAALAQNFSLIASHLPKGVGVLAMVKADAYGHGAAQVSRLLEREGVRALGVATVEEGVELKEAGIKTQILVMGGLMGMGSPASNKMVEADLTPVIHSRGVLDSLEDAAVSAGRTIKVHLKIDTGMNRLGVRPEALSSLLSHVRECSHIEVEGVMTHLADAADQGVTREQEERFVSCRGEVFRELGEIPVWHIANSIALLRGWPIDIDHAKECWVRPGLALYGDCEGDYPLRQELCAVMRLESRVMLLKRVPAGSRVSYGGTYTTARPSRLAVIPIGYADGYPWSASGKAEVLIRGQRAPIAGRVTMDMIVADVTDIEGVSVGDDVVLMGSQGDECITVRELAGWAGTITYEIFCRISKRVPRIYT